MCISWSSHVRVGDTTRNGIFLNDLTPKAYKVQTTQWLEQLNNSKLTYWKKNLIIGLLQETVMLIEYQNHLIWNHWSIFSGKT